MKAALAGVTISPVNMEERKGLGVKAGDTVRVHQKIQDKGKTRIQIFDGIVLARKHGTEPGATFTVRKVASGVGVEKIYPLYSPLIDKIEIVKRAKVRRAKLYYIREKVNREIKRQMRRMTMMSLATESATEVEAKAAADAKLAEEEAAKKAEEEAIAKLEAETKAAEAEAKKAEETSEAKFEDSSEEVPSVPAEDEIAEDLQEKMDEAKAEEAEDTEEKKS